MAPPEGLSSAPFVGQHGLVPGITKILPGGPFWSAPPPSDPDFQAFALRSLGISPEAFAAFFTAAGIPPAAPLAGTPSSSSAGRAAGTPPAAPLAETPSSSSAGRAGLFGFGAQTPGVATASGVADKSTGDGEVDLLAQAQADEAAAAEVRRQFDEKKRSRAEKAKAAKEAKNAAKESASTGEETADKSAKENTTVGSKASKEKDSANEDFDAEVSEDFEFFRVNNLTFENAVGRRVLSRHARTHTLQIVCTSNSLLIFLCSPTTSHTCPTLLHIYVRSLEFESPHLPHLPMLAGMFCSSGPYGLTPRWRTWTALVGPSRSRMSARAARSAPRGLETPQPTRSRSAATFGSRWTTRM